MPRWAARKDGNHNAIADAFRAAGASVIETHRLGDDFPDLVIGWRGRTVLVEVKNPEGRDRETEGQRLAREAWRGDLWVIVRDPAAAVTAVASRLARMG